MNEKQIISSDVLQDEIFDLLMLSNNTLMDELELWDVASGVVYLMQERGVTLRRKVSENRMYSYLYCVLSQHLGSILDYPTICKIGVGIARLFAELNKSKGYL